MMQRPPRSPLFPDTTLFRSRISAEELTVPPGADELFSLLALRRHHEGDEYDVVVVDCAPTGETLRLLSFPDVARWWLEKVFPQQGRILDAARPFARAVLDVQLPGEDRKSTRLNSSHANISYAVFCL